MLSGKLPDAEKTIADLSARKPPLAKMDQVQLGVVNGRLLEAQGKDDEAVDAYAEAAKLAGDLDLTPTMAAVTKLAELARSRPIREAAGVSRRADQLLSALAERAQEDAQLSTQLGVAYLQAGDASKAEMFLRRAVEMRDEDPEAKLAARQGARRAGSYRRSDRADHRSDQARAKAHGLPARARADVSARGARRRAITAYDKLLALPDVPLIVRANAGRFYVRKGLLDRKPELIEKGAAQSEPILSVEPENAAGLYLKGEGLILDEEVRRGRPA